MDYFHVARYRFYIQAGEQGLDLPAFKGSSLRGVMGRALRSIACFQHQLECEQCSLRMNCPYYYIFETSAGEQVGIAGQYKEVPRPYVIEPPLDGKEHFLPGEQTSFDLLLFGRAVEYLPYFLLAFERGSSWGLGAGRKPYNFLRVEAINDLNGKHAMVYEGDEKVIYNHNLSWTGREVMQLAASFNRPATIDISFITATQLKVDQQKIIRLEDINFTGLMRSLLRRYSTLSVHHHNQTPTESFQELLDAADKITVEYCCGDTRAWSRYSMRSKTRTNMVGFLGTIRFNGELEAFLPYLILGQSIHIGKWTAFGMGQYRLYVDGQVCSSVEAGVN